MKRKCGTCKFFQDRGVAGSGVCQHIQRRELRDVVLVRQTELACRNSWDQDLWEESPNPVLNAALTGVDMEEQDIVFDSQPMNMNAVDTARAQPHSSPGLRKGLAHSFPAAGLDDLDDQDEDVSALRRSSVHDARKRLDEERRRARQKEQEAHISEIGRRMASPDAIGDDDLGAQPWGVPARAPREPKEIPVAGLHEFPDEPAMASPAQPSRFLERSRPEHDQPRPVPTLNREMVEPSAQNQETEQLPTNLVQDALLRNANSGLMNKHGRQEVIPDVARLEPFVHVDGNVPFETLPREGRQVPVVSSPDVSDPIDRAEHLAALPRCCGTCRDFRQVGDGECGQCVNAYAFSDRRMVKSDQLACRSSLGTWWMPNDDVWLERADTSHHGRPTPMLDAAARAQRLSEVGRDSRAKASRVAN